MSNDRQVVWFNLFLNPNININIKMNRQQNVVNIIIQDSLQLWNMQTAKPPRHSTSNNNNNSNTHMRLHLLQSNINRVRGQHQALHAMLSDHESVSKAADVVEKAKIMVGRVEEVRDQYVLRSSTMQKKQENLQHQQQESLPQLQSRISKLKQQLQALHRRQPNNPQSKHNSKSPKCSSQASSEPVRVDRIAQFSKNQLQSLQVNIEQYLHKIKQETVATHEKRIIQYVNNYLDEDSEYNNHQWNDIEADIGMLICEIQYKLFCDQKANIANNINTIRQKKQHKQEHEGMVEGGGEEVMGMGQLQLSIACNRLHKFVEGTMQRLACQCKLLQQRINGAIQCIKANTKQKHKNSSISNKYETELLQFIQRSYAIYLQIEGSKIEVRQMSMKIRFINQKIVALGGTSPCEQLLKTVNEKIYQIQSKWKNCLVKLEQFKKLEIVFKTNQR